MISNEELIRGDKKSTDPVDRACDIRFNLKPKEYDRNGTYYLLIKDAETNIELEKVKFEINLAIMSDFEF